MSRRLMVSLIFPLALSQALPAQAPFAVATDKVDPTTLDGILKAVYSTISGPKGMKRDPELQKSLFLPGARLAATSRLKDGTVKLGQMDIDRYIQVNFPLMERDGFFEREVSRKVEQWGHIAQVFSTYESFWKADDKAPFERGINTIQLINDGHRWWVTGIAWDSEEAGQPLPGIVANNRAELGPEDAGSVDVLMKNLYGFISGPEGQKRDAARIRGLFHPECRFVVTGNQPGKGPFLRTFSLDEFMDRAVPSWEKGFYEREVKREVHTWGNMASVWTTYESRRTADGEVFMRGINNLQLQWDGRRWWVMAIQFENEDPGTKLPG